jgi:hypothetical protein
MPDSTAYKLFYAATGWIRDDLPTNKAFMPTSVACACCGRRWRETEEPAQAFAYQYGAGMAIEQTCATCYTPRVASARGLGVERFAAGNPNNPVYGKLGMLPGSGGIVTPDAELHLALPPGFIDKYGAGRFGKAGCIHASANAFVLLATLFADSKMTKASLGDGFVFIETWGRKPDVLMGTLKATRSLSELWCCSDKGAFMLDLQSIINTGKHLFGVGLLEKATKPAFWRAIMDDTKGKGSDAALMKWVTQFESTATTGQEVVNLLPIEPHSRLRTGELLRVLAPSIEQGII